MSQKKFQHSAAPNMKEISIEDCWSCSAERGFTYKNSLCQILDSFWKCHLIVSLHMGQILKVTR